MCSGKTCTTAILILPILHGFLDFEGDIIAESSADGTMQKEFFYNGASSLVMVDAATGMFNYFLNDRLGTPQRLTDDAGIVVWEAIYKPFGDAMVNPNSSVVNNFRFPGQYFDSETGLHYNWHRYYDPKIGRYLWPDPIGLEGGINLFSYVKNNPINFIDPYGLQSDECQLSDNCKCQCQCWDEAKDKTYSSWCGYMLSESGEITDKTRPERYRREREIEREFQDCLKNRCGVILEEDPKESCFVNCPRYKNDPPDTDGSMPIPKLKEYLCDEKYNTRKYPSDTHPEVKK